MDVMGGVMLDDGTEVKAVTGSMKLPFMIAVGSGFEPGPSARVCGVLARAWRVGATRGDPDRQRHGLHRPVRPRPTDVLFDKICRDNGITHRLTAPGQRPPRRSNASTARPPRVLDGPRRLTTLAAAQTEVDAWVHE